VPGVAGQVIFFCGFTIGNKGNTLDLRIFASSASDCSIDSEDFSPQWSFPGSFFASTRVDQSALATKPGYSLCIQSFGSGALTGLVYWVQIPQ
jgi:hypothetical protein